MRKYIIIIFLILIVLCSLIYVDYFNTKTNNTYPKLSLKSENDDAIIYTAVLYKVWYCKSNKSYMIGSYTEDNICPKNYEYSNGTYTNSNGVVISKKNLQLLTNDGVYTSEMIENMTDEKQVEDAVYVAFNYLKMMYKVVDELDYYKLVVFPEFKEVDDHYTWEYSIPSDNYYCVSNDGKSFAHMYNEKCGRFVSFKMDEKWCSLYKNSTLIYDEEVSELCEE